MGFVCLFVFAVHKQRDIVPLDVNGDVGNSNSDYETPVFDLKGFNDDDDDEDDDEDEDTGDATKSKEMVCNFLHCI
ncbi:something about silencing protein 10-like [Fagus crenata]